MRTFSHHITLRILGISACFLFFSQCFGPQDNFEEIRKKAEEQNLIAKQYLARGSYTEAKLKFMEVLETIDGGNSEARFGKVLSSLMEFVSLIRVVNQLTGGTQAADENEFLHGLIDDLVSDLIKRFDAMAFDLTRVKADPNFEFVIPFDAPVDLDGKGDPELNLKGRWDRGEVFLLDVPIQLVLGILNLVQAIELRADYLGIYNKFVELNIDLGGDDLLTSLEQNFPKLQNLLAFILNQNPLFLTLDAGTGKAQMSKAGTHLGNVLDSLRKALFFASLDVKLHPDQSQDIVAFLGRGSGEKGADEWAKDRRPIDPNVNLCDVRDSSDESLIAQNTFHFQVNLIYRNPEDPSAQPFYLHTSPQTGCLVGKTMESILPDNDPRVSDKGARVSLTKDIVPFILSLLQGLEIPDVPTGLLTPEIVGPILRQILGEDPLQFDFGPFFHDAVAPRQLLPAWDTPAMVSDPNAQLLWLELECLYDTAQDGVASLRSVTMQTVATGQPYRLIDRFFCREDAEENVVLRRCNTAGTLTRCDIAHFPGYNTANTSYPGSPGNDANLLQIFGIAQLSPDGVVDSKGEASDFPYIAFQDPSFNRVLWLDLYSLNLGDRNAPEFPGALSLDGTPGAELARQDTLNAALAMISKRIGPLLDLLE